jgi:autotransporter-associated beta strand protein
MRDHSAPELRRRTAGIRRRPKGWGAGGRDYLLKGIAAAIGLLVCASAQALVLHPSDESPPSVRPTDLVIGQWNGNASCVAIDPNYILTTRHQGGDVGSLVVIGTATYKVAAIFNNVQADLRVCQITTTGGAPANLSSYVPVYDAGNEVMGSTNVVLGGYGKGRGGSLTTSGIVYGYGWSGTSNTTLQWGAQRLEGTATTFISSYISSALVALFQGPTDSGYVAHEAAIAEWDSGGGWFIDVSPGGTGDWRLAALSEGATHATSSQTWFHSNTNPNQPQPDSLYAVRLADYAGWIEGVPSHSVWAQTTGGTWSPTLNWSNSASPNGMNKYAVLGNAILADSTVTLDSGVTLGTLQLDSAFSYTLNRTGTAGLVFSMVAGEAVIDDRGTYGPGAHTIAVPVTLNVPLVIAQNSGGDLVFSGAIGGNNTIRKIGAGTVVLAAPNSFSGGLSIEQGTVRVTSSGGLGSGDVSLDGGSLDLRGAVSQTFSNNLKMATNATINVDGLGGATGLTFSPAFLNITADCTLSVTSTSGSTLGFTTQAWFQNLANGVTLDTASGNLSFGSGIYLAGGSLIKTGTGALTLAGAQTYGTSITLYANQGTVNLNSDAGSSSSYRLTVSASGTTVLNFGHAEHLAALTLSNSTSATAAAGGSNHIVTKSLSMDPTARLDLKNNNLIVDYTGSSPLAAIEQAVAAGAGTHDSGGRPQWNGSAGITSSTVAANPIGLALGVRDNAFNLLNGSVAHLTTVDGVTVDNTAVVVKYTWWGDATLDGKVDVNDYNVWVYYLLIPPTGDNLTWMTGDFNYDGKIDVNDYNMWVYGFLNQSGTLGGGVDPLGLDPLGGSSLAAGGADLSGAAATPEPATLALLAAGALLAVRSKRRGRRERGER